MPLIRSWIESANSPDSPFPLNNLPHGVFSVDGGPRRCGVAIGDMIVDMTSLHRNSRTSEKRFHDVQSHDDIFKEPTWNSFMGMENATRDNLRAYLLDALAEYSGEKRHIEPFLVRRADAAMHLPISVTEYTDFYSGRHHATNVGVMFRGPENALPPNWIHMPIGYNGRASSVYVSGTPVRRPWGQIKSSDHDAPAFMPSRRFDFELEVGAIVGRSSNGPVTVREADDMIFGYVLLNDWSARDIQAWEYQPLGPFQAKATATTISPWIVTKAALEPFRTGTPKREKPLLDYLREPGPMLYDIDLAVDLTVNGSTETIARTNYDQLYYSAAQQLAHHTTSGGPMRVGDLIGSGTISGPGKDQRGSLLELGWGGKEPITVAGETRGFLRDGDILTLRGSAKGDGYTIGFGAASGKILPALDDPYARG